MLVDFRHVLVPFSQITLKREHYVEHILSYVLKSVDNLPAGQTALYDEENKSSIFNEYFEKIDLLINDWNITDSKSRLYQDLSYKLVDRGYDSIAISILNSLEEFNPQNLQQMLKIIAGRILAWQFSRANPSDSALVYSKLSEEMVDFIESSEPQNNRPILLSALAILDYISERSEESYNFCTTLSSVISMICEEGLDPLVMNA